MKPSIKLVFIILVLIASHPAMATVNSQVQLFLDKLNTSGGTPLEKLSPKAARDVLVNAQKSVKVNLSGITVQQKTIKIDDKPIGLTIVRPQSAKKSLPVFMFFHGGGWVLGDFQTHERLIRDLVTESGVAAVYVNYTPSPEAHYPTAIHQAYAATKWVAEHGKEINVDGSKLAVVGNSAGGNMAAVVALMAKEKGTPKILYQVLLWPVTNANFETGSYNEFANGYFLTKSAMKWFWDNYTTDPKERQQLLASPLQATTDQLKGLPPALIVTAENDVLRDEGEAYAIKLDAAGVPVTSIRYNGLIHDFGLLNSLANVPAVRTALHQTAEALKQHLNS